MPGGHHRRAYNFVKKVFVPYKTCMPYLACSDNSKEGFYKHVVTSCTDLNTCCTCSKFVETGGTCLEITLFLHTIVKEYVLVHHNVKKIMAEIFV